MAGVRLLSHFQIGKETTKGTPVAATKMLHPDLSAAFDLDWGYTFHESRYQGFRANQTYGTRQLERVDISYRTPSDTGVAFDELPYFFIFPGGGTAGTGSTAVTWAFAWGGTALGSAVSYTVEFGDDTQNYEAEYAQATRLAISGASEGMTMLEADFVARQSTKSTKTTLTADSDVRIAAYLWRPRFATAFSGLNAAGTAVNFLHEWSADWTTGLVPHFYADGNDYFGQFQESAPVTGNVRLVVDSNSTAVSQFYDKGEAGTVDFLRMDASGATIAGGTAYQAILEFALVYEDVTKLAGERDGVNTYEIEARIVSDATGGKAIGGTVVCNLASL
jgi:hypothetical protein